MSAARRRQSSEGRGQRFYCSIRPAVRARDNEPSSRASNDLHQAISSSRGGRERDGDDEGAMRGLEVAHINIDVATIAWLDIKRSRKGSDDRQGAAIVFALCCITRSCVTKAWNHSERERERSPSIHHQSSHLSLSFSLLSSSNHGERQVLQILILLQEEEGRR